MALRPTDTCTCTHFVFSPLATWCMHSTENVHTRQERPASSQTGLECRAVSLSWRQEWGPHLQRKPCKGMGKMNKKLLIPEGLGQIPLWPGLGPRPHSCFDVFKHMDVPMLSKPMTYSPEHESFYLSNTKGNHKNLLLEIEKTKLSMVSIFCALGLVRPKETKEGHQGGQYQAMASLSPCTLQCSCHGSMHEARNCRVQNKMTRLL